MDLMVPVVMVQLFSFSATVTCVPPVTNWNAAILGIPFAEFKLFTNPTPGSEMLVVVRLWVISVGAMIDPKAAPSASVDQPTATVPLVCAADVSITTSIDDVGSTDQWHCG